MNNKIQPIQDIRDMIKEQFPPNIFIEIPTKDINSILFKKESKDDTTTLSIIYNESSKKPYSLQLTIAGKRYRKPIGETGKEKLYIDIDMPFDKEVDKEELINIFKKCK